MKIEPTGRPDLTLVVDVRCLQDPSYARRGVGRHTLALLRHAPRRFRLLGLCDPNLPALIPEARECLAGTLGNAYAAAGADGFIELSPMTHDPHFVARLVQTPNLLKVAVVYDFIPHRNPAFYLATALARLSYAENLHWLSSYDLFCPISRSAGDDLADMLGIPAGRIRTTGAPVDPVFNRAAEHEARQGEPRHLLVVGGGDPRKNPDTAVLAHARSAKLQAAKIPLVIAGNYGEVHRQTFRDLANANGGSPDLIEVPGRISDDELVALYANAYALVAPSRDEGFSLPVVEGMAAGVPSIGSDIPAHRELLVDTAWRFSPDDAAGLSALMERLVDDAELRADIVAQQAGVWRRYLDHEVGRRFWDAVSGRFDGYWRAPHPALARGRRPRVALLSPLPPDRSGVADYTAATVAELGQLVELDVFSATVDPAPLPGAASVRPLDAFAHISPAFDRVISVIGNSHFHTRILDLQLRYGGAAIAHDARMLAFYRAEFGLPRTIAAASDELGRPVSGGEITNWLADESNSKALFLKEIFRSSSPMIVHSPVTVRLVAERYGAPPAYVPFSVYRPWRVEALTPDARAQARRRLGLTGEEIAIASFGFVHPTKAPEECIWAIDILRRWRIPATLHFVGGLGDLADRGAKLIELAARLGVVPYVRFTGDYVSEQTYRDYLVGADLAVQLRTYTLGGLSGALIDCAAAGLPTVANQSLADAVGVPASYNRSINDALSPLLVAEALAELHEAGLDRRRPEEARRVFSEERSLANYSGRLCRVLGLDVPAACWQVPERKVV